jgi:TRAP-type mannitol/chloroaromatic compound transport system permease small subunit
VVPIAFFTGLQMLDRKLGLGVSSILPNLSTSLLFILIFMTFGFTYLRDGHVRVDVFRWKWSPKALARIEITGCLIVLLPLSVILVNYGWDGLMRTTRFADNDIWARPIAAVIGPAFLGLAGVIVIARNISFLRGHRDDILPSSEEDLPHGE